MKDRLIELLRANIPTECDNHKSCQGCPYEYDSDGCYQSLAASTTVYVIIPDFDNVIEGVITNLEYNLYTTPKEWITVKAEFPIFGLMERKGRIDLMLGKTVFLTREEAERALKEREQK